MKLDEIERKTRHLVAQAQQAQKTIDQERRIRERDACRRGVLPSQGRPTLRSRTTAPSSLDAAPR